VNYKTIIAFLGKKQLQRYQPDKSEWIYAGTGRDGWSKEFMELNGLKNPHERFEATVNINASNKNVIAIKCSGWTCSESGSKYYYNPEHKVLSMINIADLGKNGLQTYIDFFDGIIRDGLSEREIKISGEFK